MGEILRETRFGANDIEDMVDIRMGDMRPRVPYPIALEIAHHLRMRCKHAARFDQAPGSFWCDVDMEDLNDCPAPRRGYRRSQLVPNVDKWEVGGTAQLVGLYFDGVGQEMDYETGVKLHMAIRRAGRRAKAWAGDTGKTQRMLSNLTDAVMDNQLGI